MAYRLLTVALVAASVVTLSGSALAQKKDPTTDSINLNSSRSNIDRMGGGGGTTVKSSKSNTSDRMGGGGGTKGGAADISDQAQGGSMKNKK
jgi:hypothetical protein